MGVLFQRVGDKYVIRRHVKLLDIYRDGHDDTFIISQDTRSDHGREGDAEKRSNDEAMTHKDLGVSTVDIALNENGKHGITRERMNTQCPRC